MKLFATLLWLLASCIIVSAPLNRRPMVTDTTSPELTESELDFLKSMKSALSHDELDWLLSRVSLPFKLRTTNGVIALTSRDQLHQHSHDIFSEDVRAALLSPGATVAKNSNGVRVANGVIWFVEVAADASSDGISGIYIVAINPPKIKKEGATQ